MRFLQSFFGRLAANAPDRVLVRYKRYHDTIDLTGQNIITLAGATREDTRKLIPFLVDPVSMDDREVPVANATATMISEVADEIHEFKNVRQGRTRIRRILLKKDRVIELTLS